MFRRGTEQARPDPVRSGRKTGKYSSGCGTSQLATVARLRLRDGMQMQDAGCTPEREESQCSGIDMHGGPGIYLPRTETRQILGSQRRRRQVRCQRAPGTSAGFEKGRSRSLETQLVMGPKVRKSCDLQFYEEGNVPRRAAFCPGI